MNAEPKYLVREGRYFKVARIGKDGLLKIAGRINPFNLAYVGSEVIGLTKRACPSVENEALKEFYAEALRRAKKAKADFVLGKIGASTQDSYSRNITFIGTIDFYLS